MFHLMDDFIENVVLINHRSMHGVHKKHGVGRTILFFGLNLLLVIYSNGAIIKNKQWQTFFWNEDILYFGDKETIIIFIADRHPSTNTEGC